MCESAMSSKDGWTGGRSCREMRSENNIKGCGVVLETMWVGGREKERDLEQGVVEEGMKGGQ